MCQFLDKNKKLNLKYNLKISKILLLPINRNNNIIKEKRFYSTIFQYFLYY